ncbi:hypothetical protein HDU87_001507 [Geranomyces variabilis]|uniref:Protein BFR2 n=1 Tax=Geranomyces variabilis TaxID=109894 RepID=A0AAD5XLT5_9FUNG|nr:hypothetical protein HDU87_001507 [Geranomyces variabilis]
MSLQAFLKDLSSTTPVDFDPERDPADASGPADGSDDEAFAEGLETAADPRAHYVNVGRGSIRTRTGVELDDKKYAGKRVSRDSIFRAVNSEEEAEEEDEDDEESEDFSATEVDADAGLESDEIVGSSGDEDEAENDDASEGDSDEDEADDVDRGSSEEGDEQESESDADDDEQSESESNNRLAKELEQLEVEEKKLIKTMSASARADVEKGHHVRAQITLWDGLLDSRIRIQRAVNVANRFPKPDLHPAFAASSSDAQAAIDDASQELVALVDDLIDLRTALISQNPAVQPLYAEDSQLTIAPFSGERTESLKRKRDQEDPDALLEAVWADVQPLDAQFKPYRDQTIDKWNSKVQVATGIPLQKKFKAINQTVVSQINQILSDKPRLIKRSQLRRSDHLPLGQAAVEDAAADSAQANDETTDAHLANYDEEIFDDGDYYQQLLKELIESRITDADDAVLNGLKWAHFKSLKNKDKKKKRVDTKASKGRKIRFHVHEKLQNYMAPEPRGSWHDSMVDELFGGLLGQGVEHAAVVEEPVDEPAADGFRIM